MSDSDFKPLFINTAEGESNDSPSGSSSFNAPQSYDEFYLPLDDDEGSIFMEEPQAPQVNPAQNQEATRFQQRGQGQNWQNKQFKNKEATPHSTREQRAERDLLERIPPHNLTAEKSLLGGVFLNYSLMHSLVDIVKPEDFYVPAHHILFKDYISLYRLSKPIDPNSLLIYLEDNQQLEQIGGSAYLSELVDLPIAEESAKHYAEIIRDRSMQRELITACADIIGSSYSPGVVVDELLADSEKSIFSISERKSAKGFESIGSLTDKIFDIAVKRADQKASVTGIPTDYTDLDRITAGLQPSDLIILAARPAMGKTAFALNLAMRTAVNYKTPVAIFSLEMSAISLAERMISLWAKVELTKLKRGFLDDGDWQRLHDAASQLEGAPIFIDDTGELNTLSLRAKCRRLKAEHGLKFVIVDYLQLMRSSRTDSRELEISDISRNLKALAKELDIPVLALSQLNRKVEERADKRPMLSDLRESGAIEQDADIIMFIHREDAYNKDGSRPMTNEAEIILGKHRNGSTGTVRLAFLAQYTAFENLQY